MSYISGCQEPLFQSYLTEKGLTNVGMLTSNVKEVTKMWMPLADLSVMLAGHHTQ